MSARYDFAEYEEIVQGNTDLSDISYPEYCFILSGLAHMKLPNEVAKLMLEVHRFVNSGVGERTEDILPR